ncbi:MAG: threonine synthase [Thermoanaerobaculia bacterium]
MSGDERWARCLISSASGDEAPVDSWPDPDGAPWLVDYGLDPGRGRELLERLARRRAGLWRWRELLPVRDVAQRVDLGEGGTPLVPLRRAAPPGIDVLVKQEAGNPTGSFKARGLAVAITRARELGAPGVELASAGNAALAATAYAARAVLPCRVALPVDTPRSIQERCRLLGAEVLVSGRTLVESAAALKERATGFWNLATLREPWRLEGKKTMGLELAEQLGWRLPDWILYPTGGGTGLIGMFRAFAQLRALGLVAAEDRPRFVAVQMAGCAPIVRAFEQGAERAQTWESPATRVWGLRVPRAVGDSLILQALRESDGLAIAVAEEAVEPARTRLAREEGIEAGPEGAACYVALEHLAANGTIAPNTRVVLFQTGHPLNYAD